MARVIRALPPSPFHIVLDLSISNDPVDAAAYFDGFFRGESRPMSIAAAYTEMNRFDINPDRWYCDVFAYDRDGGHDDYHWPSARQSERFDEYQINGLELLQEVYAGDALQNQDYRDARYMSSLMVVLKFQRFIHRAAEHIRELRFPLYVTAHEFDFIASFDPKSQGKRRRTRNA